MEYLVNSVGLPTPKCDRLRLEAGALGVLDRI